MKKTLFLLILLTICFAGNAFGQRKSVSVAEVTGTFRMNFKGKFKDFANEIKIASIGNGKVKVGFELVYPHFDGEGNPSPNMGTGGGTAKISGDTAIYENNEFGPCKITIKFVKAGTIKVTQEGSDADCGFGHNVTAEGTYKKISSKKPKFDAEN
jgi:hypothetical protein